MLYSVKGGEGLKISVLDLPDEAVICSCEAVTKGKMIMGIKTNELTNVAGIKKCCKAGTGCGGCVPMLDDILTAYLSNRKVRWLKKWCANTSITLARNYLIL